MANSLQDQLMKAGLASADQARTTNTKKRKQRKSGKPRDDTAHKAVVVRRAGEADHARTLNAKKEAERKDRETRLRIRDLILAASAKAGKATPKKAPDSDKSDESKPTADKSKDESSSAADVPYNVLHGSKVRRIYITAAQREGLGMGKLAIATAKGRHHVIPMQLADEIMQLMPDYFVYRPQLADKNSSAESSTDVDDPYKDYEVPDDLMW